jgi:osmotically-inducible protein OsmY
MGVKGVSNLISLRGTPAPADIKQRIRSSLKRQAEVDADEMSVEATGSRVTLHGNVRSVAERREAERAAWNAPGVTRVDNDITVSLLAAAAV